MADYVVETGHWQEWQRAYQYGTLLLFPPEPLLSQVNRLRAAYDPQSQATCDAHISLTVPLPRPMHDGDWRELAAIAAGIEAFTIQVGPLMNYLPHPGVCLAIEPQETLDRLRLALERASIFSRAPARTHPFSAHMTIAELISVAQTHALMDELEEIAPTGQFLCSGVSYAVPDAHFHFTERNRLLLAQ